MMLHTLAQRCQIFYLEAVSMDEAEEEDAAEGWAALAKALHLCPGFDWIEVSRRVMLLAERRDLRTIWDALGTDIGDLCGGFWWILGVEKYEDDDSAARFQPDWNFMLELQKGHEPEEDNEKRLSELE